MSRVDSVAAAWRKASRCDSHSCVEIAHLDREVAVRDSTQPITNLTFDAASWRALVGDLQNGQLHRG